MSEQSKNIEKHLEGVTFKTLGVNNKINIMYHNDDTNILYSEDIPVEIKNNKLQTKGIELVNQAPVLFSNILQDKYNQEGNGEQVDFENVNDLKAMEALADIAIEQGNDSLHYLENRFKVEELDIEVKDQDLINMFNYDIKEVESFYSIKLGVNEVEADFKYRLSDKPTGQLILDSATSDEQINKLVTELSIPEEDRDNFIEKIEDTVKDELFIYEEQIVENKFEDDLGLANEEMANRVFIGRNKIDVEAMEIVYENDVPKLLSTVEFQGGDADYHPDNKATFTFDLAIDGKKLKKDGSNLTVDTSDNTLRNRSEANNDAINKLMKNNLPYKLKDDTYDKALITSIIGRRVNDDTYHTFENKKQELILSSDLNEKVNNDAKQSKNKNLNLSM